MVFPGIGGGGAEHHGGGCALSRPFENGSGPRRVLTFASDQANVAPRSATPPPLPPAATTGQLLRRSGQMFICPFETVFGRPGQVFGRPG